MGRWECVKVRRLGGGKAGRWEGGKVGRWGGGKRGRGGEGERGYPFVLSGLIWVSPISTRLFFFKNMYARVSGYVDLNFTICPLLHISDRFCRFLFKKGTNCAILNLNNRRLRRLKVHVILQKSLVLMGKPYIFFE